MLSDALLITQSRCATVKHEQSVELSCKGLKLITNTQTGCGRVLMHPYNQTYIKYRSENARI